MGRDNLWQQICNRDNTIQTGVSNETLAGFTPKSFERMAASLRGIRAVGAMQERQNVRVQILSTAKHHRRYKNLVRVRLT